MPAWKNLTPRLGAAYDVFGNGRTAVKFSIGKYLEAPNPPAFTRVANPAGGLVQSATRTWTDRNNDFVPQASELGALNPTNFGTTVVSSRYADDVLTSRMSNWELAAQVQHEIYPRMSVNVGYFRAGRQPARDGQPVDHAVRYSPYSVTAPVDSRLPGGGGYKVDGLYDANRLVSQNNVISLASKFGTATEVFNGVDLTVNARLPKGVIVSGGPSWGRTETNYCFAVDSPQGTGLPPAQGGTSAAGLLYCEVKPPFQPNEKLIGVYPLPGRVSSSRRRSRASPVRADHRGATATNLEIQPSLGRRWQPAPPARPSSPSFSRARCTTNGCTSSTSASPRFSGLASSACRQTWTSTTPGTPAPSCRTT